MRYCRRITLSSSMLRGDRPTTPRRLPTICSILSILSGSSALRSRRLRRLPCPSQPCPWRQSWPFAAWPCGSLGLCGSLAFGRLSGGLAGSALGTMNTTTFLRRMATAWPFLGIPASRRTTARSAWPLSMAAAAAGGPPSTTLVCSRMLNCSRANCAAIDCTTRVSSLLGGPTAMVSSVGCVEMMIGNRANAAAQQDRQR